MALAAWGRIREADQPEYERDFELFPAKGRHAHHALVSGQARELSPLAQSVRLLRPYGSFPGFERCLWVFERASFDEVIEFWNLRSRAPDWRGQALVLGVAREALARPEDLRPLGTWLARDELFQVKPDLGLWVTSSSRDAAAHALEDLGFRRAEGTRITRYDRDQVPADRREPEYGFFRPSVATEMQRGAIAHDLITVTQGQATFRPRRPQGFEVRTGHHVRLALQGLPLALPLSSAAAAGTLTNAYRSPEGITIETDAYAGTDGYLTVRIPDRWEALEGWAADGGTPCARRRLRVMPKPCSTVSAVSTRSTLWPMRAQSRCSMRSHHDHGGSWLSAWLVKRDARRGSASTKRPWLSS